MAIKTYDDFYKFFNEYPRELNSVDKHGYQVIIESEEWDESYLEDCFQVIFHSRSGQWDGAREDWIVGLIIDEICKIDNDFYHKLIDEDWFQKNINPDYACVQDLYTDYNYNEDKYIEEIQSGKYASYDDYIHHLAEDYVNYLKEELKN